MIGETCSNMLATHSMRYPAEPFSPADEVFLLDNTNVRRFIVAAEGVSA